MRALQFINNIQQFQVNSNELCMKNIELVFNKGIVWELVTTPVLF